MPEETQRFTNDFTAYLIDATIDGTIVLDPDYRVQLWNRQCSLFTGISEADAVGRHFFSVLPGIGTHQPSLDALQQAKNGYHSFIAAEHSAYPEGKYESHCIPIRTGTATVTAIMLVLHDVSHRIKTETSLKELNRSLAGKNRELKRQNAELQAYSHLTSHEFKEPMQHIYTSVEHLLTEESGKLSASGKISFRHIQGALQRMRLLADDLLNLSGRSRQSSGFADVDLQTVLSITVSRLQEPIAASGAIVHAANLPVYRGNQVMLAQLFQHIIGNALKFQVPGNRPVIGISTESVSGTGLSFKEADPSATYLVIRFTDNGIGFDPQYAKDIFRVFMRIDKKRFGGSGVGLALCKKITELHGGFIEAESAPGKGSVFHCYLEENLA
ncbi:sensor histidine kinase [Sediminibacterium soli]|uniref:sensor histidine kinase n=1 Tax=Sediminibacterium soli TaxID=2698829 RepID=UPI00137A381F|nr:ATP-binding protein [Sediminibacterium soli]NCI46749.1 PAS domain-containing protein [Sediminibacterium soli]